jgi:hypothetical protein
VLTKAGRGTRTRDPFGDVRAFAALGGNEALARIGAHLDTDRYEDFLSFLVKRCVVVAPRYDPSYGFASSTFLSRRLRFAVIDWMRQNLGARYGTRKPHAHTHRLNNLDETLFRTEPEREQSLADTIIQLGRHLSPDARWALVNLAGRMAQGTDEWSALKESSVRFGEANRRLELLREELRPIAS